MRLLAWTVPLFSEIHGAPQEGWMSRNGVKGEYLVTGFFFQKHVGN